MNTNSNIIARRREILEDTIQHFNSNNRSVVNNNRRCLYSGNGCAIGRLIKDKELCLTLDDLNGGWSDTSVVSVWPLLPDELKELGQKFLVSLQTLHDIEEYWDINGLSVSGHLKHLDIAKHYCQ